MIWNQFNFCIILSTIQPKEVVHCGCSQLNTVAPRVLHGCNCFNNLLNISLRKKDSNINAIWFLICTDLIPQRLHISSHPSHLRTSALYHFFQKRKLRQIYAPLYLSCLTCQMTETIGTVGKRLVAVTPALLRVVRVSKNQLHL